MSLLCPCKMKLKKFLHFTIDNLCFKIYADYLHMLLRAGKPGPRRGRPVKAWNEFFNKVDINLKKMVWQCWFKNVIGTNWLHFLSFLIVQPYFCQKMNLNSFHQGGVWKMSKGCIFKFLKMQSVQNPSLLSKDVFE